MLQDRNSAGIYIGPGKHGHIHKQKYFDKNQAMPVNIVLGSDPLDWFAASCPVPAGISEFDFAGGLRGAPTQVIRSDITRLPYPADAEIVLEGEIRPGELREEGPFGEWPGYYASPKSLEPCIRVKRILHRNDPIVSCANPARPPHTLTLLRAITRSAHGRSWKNPGCRRFAGSGRTNRGRGNSPSSPSSSVIQATSNKPA
jgi:4-hydroxy-3-polyprenylbenzoate decarboxylase